VKFSQAMDILEVARLRNAEERWGKRFLDRLFTSTEQTYCDSKIMKFEHYAARFSAKEAALKALNVGANRPWKFKKIEVRREASGKPYLNFEKGCQEELFLDRNVRLELSLTHERKFAAATAVVITS